MPSLTKRIKISKCLAGFSFETVSHETCLLTKTLKWCDLIPQNCGVKFFTECLVHSSFIRCDVLGLTFLAGLVNGKAAFVLISNQYNNQIFNC